MSFVVNCFGFSVYFLWREQARLESHACLNIGCHQPKWAAIAFGISCILDWTLWMIRPRVWDYNEAGALKRWTSLGAEKRGIMTTGRYDSSEGSHIGTAITFLLIGLGGRRRASATRQRSNDSASRSSGIASAS